MINDGRESGWLKLPVSAMQPWAEFHGAQLNGIRFDSIPGKEERGTAIVADEDFTVLEGDDDDNHYNIMVIPQNLILSRKTVEEISKSNYHLREILEATGPFAKVKRFLTRLEVIVKVIEVLAYILSTESVMNKFVHDVFSLSYSALSY